MIDPKDLKQGCFYLVKWKHDGEYDLLEYDNPSCEVIGTNQMFDTEDFEFIVQLDLAKIEEASERVE